MAFPDICVVDSPGCPAEWQTLHYVQMTCGQQVIRLRHRSGEPYVLDSACMTVSLWAKDTFGGNTFFLTELPGVIIDAADGAVSFSLTSDQAGRPGLYLGEVVVRQIAAVPASSASSAASESSSAASAIGSSEGSSAVPSGCAVLADCVAIFRARCYVEISPSLEDPTWHGGTLSTAEVRLAMRDKCAADNFLLDNVEFSDAEICFALRRPVDLWNDTPPPLRPLMTTANFPYRAKWLDGVVGELLGIAAMNYERARLRYAASNLSVDDRDKSSWYLQLSAKMKAEYLDWLRLQKRSLNLALVRGSSSLRSFGNQRGFGW